jgi:hypothetical protein
MPTLSEIVAAKKAAQSAAAPAAPPPSPLAKRESIAEAADLLEAIDRIDPPGKRARAVTRGLILTDKQPPRTEQPPPLPTQPEERALSTTAGEMIDTAPATSDPQVAAWNQAAVGLESELVVMSDPTDPTVCWLALRPSKGRPLPLLLHRLPWTLWEHPQTPRTEDAPF